VHVSSLLAALILPTTAAVPVRTAAASPVPAARATTRPAAPVLAQTLPGSPITVDADVITYDAARQIVTAQGNVRVSMREFQIFAEGMQYDLRTQVATVTGRVRVLDSHKRRELRGRSLTYNVRTEEGVIEGVDGIVDVERRVYVRGARLEFTPARLVGHDILVTNCDPATPLLSTTARRIEIYPDQELIADDAAVHLGSRRLYSSRRLRISLRPDEAGFLFPGFGSNAVDGFWLDRRFRVRAPQTEGDVHVKYGFDSGLFAYLTLTRQMPQYNATLRLGRTQSHDTRQAFDLLPYDVAEIALASRRVQLGTLPVGLELGAAAGWFRERNTGLSTTRLDGTVSLHSARIPVAPRLTAGGQAGIRFTQYGTGETRTITSFGADLTYEIAPLTTVTLGYAYVNIRGPQPLLIDNVEPASTISLSVARAVPDRYSLTLGAAHNAALAENKYYGAVAVVVRRNFEVGVSAIYNSRLGAFEDIDYTVRAICDCLDITLRYRQVRREFAFEVGLIGLGASRSLVPRSPSPPPTLPPPAPDPERSQ
jgi:lipopolysaccharide export system protein LptA